MNGNVLLGLGFSAPTGDRDVQDNFLIPFGTTPRTQQHAVDQSIQLGVGGWGVLFDLYAYRQIVPRLNAYLNGLYTMTPEEKYTPTASLSGDYSIPDSYLGRGGFQYLLWPKHSLSLSLGARIDGVPVHDLTGGSEGFRRPGYAISIEPGLSLSVKSLGILPEYPGRGLSQSPAKRARARRGHRTGRGRFCGFPRLVQREQTILKGLLTTAHRLACSHPPTCRQAHVQSEPCFTIFTSCVDGSMAKRSPLASRGTLSRRERGQFSETLRKAPFVPDENPELRG